MSVSLTVRIEPNMTVSRMCVFTFADTHSSAVAPIASEIDRNTPISVSADIFVRLRVKFSTRPNSRQKLNIDMYGAVYDSPMMTPMATPVSAALPTACEKNAMRFATTIVPMPPSSGPMTSAHRKPLTTNAYENV